MRREKVAVIVAVSKTVLGVTVKVVRLAVLVIDSRMTVVVCVRDTVRSAVAVMVVGKKGVVVSVRVSVLEFVVAKSDVLVKMSCTDLMKVVEVSIVEVD